jgi:hypothetical protein
MNNSMMGGQGYRGPAGNYNDRAAGKQNIFSGDKIPKSYKAGQLQQYTPEQLQQFLSLFPYLQEGGYLSKLAAGDESAFTEMEAPAWRQFQEAQGQLGSRFSQLAPGAMSAQRGSGFQNQAGQLGSDFAMQLASKRQELSRQALQDLFGLSESLLNQRPYERTLTEKPKKWWEQPLATFTNELARGTAKKITGGGGGGNGDFDKFLAALGGG